MSALSCLDFRHLPMQTLWQDLKYGLRMLAKSPGFAAIAILTLALGIGASTAIFSVVDAVLLRPLPYPNPQQIVTVWEKEANGHRARLADPNFLDFRSQNQTLQGLATFFSAPESVSGGSEPVRVNVALVSQDFFKVMGVEPFRGREFSADEMRVNGAPAMIVSYGYWQQYLGGRADFSRAHLSMDGKAYSVVGVMPQGFDFDAANVAVWVPREPYGWSTTRSSHNGEGIARLRDGVSIEQARTDLDTIARRIHAEYGKSEISDYFLTDATAIPLADFIVENVRAADHPDLFEFRRCVVNESAVVHGPELIAVPAEIFKPQPDGVRIRYQRGTPIVENLQPADFHVGLLDVNPIVRRHSIRWAPIRVAGRAHFLYE